MDMKKIILVWLMAACILQNVAAQKQTTSVSQAWLAYFNQTRFSDKWGLWADVHLRTKEDVVQDLSTFIGRVGLTYYINDQTKLTAGYAYINHFPAEGHENISRPEHRPWQQIQWHTNYRKVRLMNYIRLEERYRRKIASNDALADGYNFNYRVRYNLLFNAALGKKEFSKGALSFIANDELHVNFGKEVVNNYFDQNRFFLGLGYHTSAKNQLQFGYMNIFQQLPAGNRYRSTHALRLFFMHNIDAR